MSVVTYAKFRPSLVRPYTAVPALSVAKASIARAYACEMYDSHDYVAALPVSRVLGHTNPTVSFKGTESVIDEPFILGQYHNTTLEMIVPQEASHDVLTDILSGLYWSLCDEVPELSYVFMQAYLLMSRMSLDTPPMFGGKETRYEVKTYGL